MSSLQSRVEKMETGIDVSKLAPEQIQMLDMSKLSREQWAALDILLLTGEQIMQIGLRNLTDEQLTTLGGALRAEEQRWLDSLSDEELDAVVDGDYERWEPGFKPESNA